MLAWDQVGDRRFESGIDRGVLYLDDDLIVPWNGLVSLAETLGYDIKSYYVDGVKYLDHQMLGSFAGSLQAFTYPDELEDFLGIKTFAPGVYAHDQRPKPFTLCYRTGVGNDVSADLGYKLHILYDIIASPGNNTAGTIKQDTAPQLFDWALSGIPSVVDGIRPTNHISLHSQSLDSELLSNIEDLLYGTDEAGPELPTLQELLSLVEDFYEEEP